MWTILSIFCFTHHAIMHYVSRLGSAITMQPRGILETCLYVDNLDAAEAFYTRVLGLRLVGKEEGRHLFFRCGRGMLLIFNPDKTRAPDNEVPTHGAYGPVHVAFAIPAGEIDHWREHLRAHGVAIEQEVIWPHGGHSIYFRDPAGNSLELATSSLWGMENDGR